MSGSGAVMEDSAERTSGRKRPVILTQPPALQAASFLLRSPMVAGMRHGADASCRLRVRLVVIGSFFACS